MAGFFHFELSWVYTQADSRILGFPKERLLGLNALHRPYL